MIEICNDLVRRLIIKHFLNSNDDIKCIEKKLIDILTVKQHVANVHA